MRRSILSLILAVPLMISAAPAPPNWGDFQMGLVNNGRPLWDDPMRDAMNTDVGGKCPYQLDRRYIYIDDSTNMKAYWGTDGVASNNWSRDSYYASKNVAPAIVIYMLQRGGDSWSAAQASMSNAEFMKAYFHYITVIADSSRGKRPIYVLEPDVWSYMLQKARESDPLNQNPATKHDDWSLIVNNNFDDLCHINDLGYPWLSEFENKASNLPGAIIKTLKMVDPECYAGILIGFWGFKPNGSTHTGLFLDNSDIIAISARETGKFVNHLLSSTPYRGDFSGIEKNGTDLGYWKTLTPASVYATDLDWDDRSNGDWVTFAKTIGDSANLPMIGWQIAIGNATLPNTINSYMDTYFPYFFSHTQDFIDAGFIGMLAGCANQDRGTVAVPPGGKSYTNGSFGVTTLGDQGWFYSQVSTFNAARPWLPVVDTFCTVVATVIPDSVFTPGEVTDPLFDPAAQYGNADHGKTFCYNNMKYEFIGYWSTVGQAPDAAPSNWKNLGPYGTLVVTYGGMVDNSSIYYAPGSTFVRDLKPVALDGYGIEYLLVNGVKQDPAVTLPITSIGSNYTIGVKFKYGATPISDMAGSERSVRSANMLPVAGGQLIRLGGLTKATLSLYTPQGRQVMTRDVADGEIVGMSMLAGGMYLSTVSVDGRTLFSSSIINK